MAYADSNFYTADYHGAVIDDDSIDRWLDRASDELDARTYGRLTFAFPTVTGHVAKVKKAVCAIAEALFLIDVQQQAMAAQKASDGIAAGSYHGNVSSITSGKESISFSQIGASASMYASAAASTGAQARLISTITCKYLANVPDANGINLLYAGVV